jgi:hypothetical protein
MPADALSVLVATRAKQKPSKIRPHTVAPESEDREEHEAWLG